MCTVTALKFCVNASAKYFVSIKAEFLWYNLDKDLFMEIGNSKIAKNHL